MLIFCILKKQIYFKEVNLKFKELRVYGGYLGIQKR